MTRGVSTIALILSAFFLAVFVTLFHPAGIKKTAESPELYVDATLPVDPDISEVTEIAPPVIVTLRPKIVQHEVPFTPQAPYANWDDRRYQNACEEASILMVWSFFTGQSLDADRANQAIADMVAFEQANYGFYIDSSAADSVRIFKEYFNYDNVELVEDITLKKMLTVLAEDKLIILPVDGRLLGNPYFTPPGPDRHMVVVTGYDEDKETFYVHDPGTRRGEHFAYSFEVLLAAARDYLSGDHLPVTEDKKVMIVVGAE
jgi:hypothetical protein